ncbi:uncharacterized protein A4U43_C04F27000 [Asparagus officinalis]|uniref:Carbohydrate kinase PfkB domain-containing protein n=1 Tax=Asparagus officinalis TaxID=4686 RepID=A0A5P1F3Z8_ASPOF|nr:uncharacterized protein A4U43_C04F27000 [Asparagus officinalis]
MNSSASSLMLSDRRSHLRASFVTESNWSKIAGIATASMSATCASRERDGVEGAVAASEEGGDEEGVGDEGVGGDDEEQGLLRNRRSHRRGGGGGHTGGAAVCCFGDDEFGHMLADILRKNGVEDEGVLFDKHARTALAFVTLKSNGEREFMFYRNPSADMLLTESEINLNLIRRAKIFHYGSISLIAAKEAGILLSYDPNVRLPLWPSEDAARDGIKSIWNEADFIKVSDDEVAFLTKGDPTKEDVVLSLWFEGLKLLIVTDGEKGCRYFTKGFKGSVAGYSVKTVDTTGAGDAFVGALLVSIAKDDSIFQNEEKLREALAFANACGAICTTQKGAIPALPTTADALELVGRGK